MLPAFLSQAGRALAGEETARGYRGAVVRNEALDASQGDLAERLQSR